MINLVTISKLSQMHLMNTPSHWLSQECVDDDDGNDDTSNRDNNIHIYTLIYYLYYLLSAFNNFFPNIKLKYTTIQEMENIIKSLKPKNMYGYDEIPLLYLK